MRKAPVISRKQEAPPAKKRSTAISFEEEIRHSIMVRNGANSVNSPARQRPPQVMEKRRSGAARTAVGQLQRPVPQDIVSGDGCQSGQPAEELGRPIPRQIGNR